MNHSSLHTRRPIHPCSFDRSVGKKSSSRGYVLIDVMIAVALSSLFIYALAESSNLSTDIFNRALAKSRLIDIFESHAEEISALMPGQSLSYDDFKATANWYGNDRVEIIATAKATSTLTGQVPTTTPSVSSSLVGEGLLSFVMIENYPYHDLGTVTGTPLCSPRFMEKNPVGSFGYLTDLDMESDTERRDPTHYPSQIVADQSTIDLPLNGDINLTGLEVRGNIAYLSADSSTSADPDLLVADISDPTDPVIVSAVNSGPGLSMVAIAPDYVYGAALSTAAQLHVFGVDEADHALLVAKYRLPLPYATATPPLSSSIFYNAGKIYLGTEKWGGEEFNIIDVSDPHSPRKLGGFEVGSKVGAIYVRDDIAYIATAGSGQMVVIDVSDSAMPVAKQNFSPSGWQRQEGKSLSVFEGNIGFGRTTGGYNVTSDHELFTFHGTSTLPLSSPSSTDLIGGAYGIIFDKQFIFVGTRSPDHEVMVYNRDLTASTSLSLHTNGGISAMTCDDNKIYFLAHDEPRIYQVEFHRSLPQQSP